MLNHQRLRKRDTIADFWNRRLNDMALRDDPVESGYNSGNTGGATRSDSAAYLSGSGSGYGGAQSYGGGGGGRSQPAPSSNVYGVPESTRAPPPPPTQGYGGVGSGGGQDAYVETPSTGCCTCMRGRPGSPVSAKRAKAGDRADER